MTEVIALNDVVFRYGREPLIEDVSLTVGDNELVGLIGPNGCGKSSLLKIMVGLLAPAKGRVRVLGQPPTAVRRHLGYVPQTPPRTRHFPITVEQVVLSGRLGRTRSVFGYSRSDRVRAEEVMVLTDTMALRGRSVGTLSGGELQRVMLARALAGDPQVLILDEPTASMDPGSEARIFELLRELTSRVTVIMSSHDVGMISRYANRIACLNRRLTVLPPEALDAEAVYAIYTGKAPGEAAA